MKKLPIAVGRHPSSSYAAQVLEQLGITSLPVETIQEGVAMGLRVFLWSGFYEQGDASCLSNIRVAVITDNCASLTGLRDHDDVEGRSYYFNLPSTSPFGARSFYANLPVVGQPGHLFGACHDWHDQEMPLSGIAVREEPGRFTISLPWDICGYEQGVEWTYRPYCFPTIGKPFVEIGPSLDTGAFRRLLLEMLRHCFKWAGLPLIRVSSFYQDKQYFSFRIDADGFTQSSTEAALRVAEKTGLRFTWFLDMSCWGKHREYVARLQKQGQDVQLHCFRHMTYSSQKVNAINIRKGLKELRKNNVIPDAIVSPLGYNYRGFSEAIRKNGFVFSSEFGYAVDDLPSWPWNDRSYPLQVPVHPACSGVFSQAGFSCEEQFSHLADTIQKQCDMDGICVFYDHPIGGLETHESNYRSLFDQLICSPYEYICLSDYCRAWLQRPVNPTILFAEGRVWVDGFQNNGFRLEQIVEQPGTLILWADTPVPQVTLPARDHGFQYADEKIQAIANDKTSSRFGQSDITRFGWYAREVHHALTRVPGYSRFRRSLCQVRWLRAMINSVQL
ncbi:MAG: hypothetical protein JW818_21375 [Pirellulales bacterium]|nr:hypothetical protein [Pirellulales bacterium]